MAKRNTKKTAKRKNVDNRTWFEKVSRGGTRFINLLNPYNYARLTDKERKYLEFQINTRQYNLSAELSAYKEGSPEFRENIRYWQQQILRGNKFKESMDTFGENYKTAMQSVGAVDMAKLFDKIYNRMSYDEKYDFSKYDLPEIPIFYRMKQMAETGKRSNQAAPIMVDSALENLARKLIIEGFRTGELTINDLMANDELWHYSGLNERDFIAINEEFDNDKDSIDYILSRISND